MEIVMTRPVFKCAEDEVIFLARVKELPGFDYVLTKEQKLYLNFSDTPEPSTLVLLEDICAQWNSRLV